MRSALFIDTSAWIALDILRDSRHPDATSFWEADIGGARDFRWFTTNWVISEVLTILRRQVHHAAAVRFGERVFSSTLLEVIRVEPADEHRAWAIFRGYKDKGFGFVDCASFAVMERLAIEHAFTFDRHFEQMGYTVLPSS